MNIDEIRLVEKEMRKIIPIYLSEFIATMPVDKRMYLCDESNLCRIISFSSGIGASTRDNNIYFAVQNSNTFKRLSKKPDYGMKKGTPLVTDEEFIDNDKDYLDYFEYALNNGLKEIDYCLDILPHEIMHLIGCGDGIIGEGVTELKTRRICKKYGIRCAPVLYSKEMKLAQKLERVVGEMELEDATFFNEFSIIIEKCDELLGGEKFTDAYWDLCADYRDYEMDRILDPFEHYKNYRKVDFSKIYELLDSIEIPEAKRK